MTSAAVSIQCAMRAASRVFHRVFSAGASSTAGSLVFEAERPEPNVMRRPPRKRTDGLFSPATVGLALAQGFSILAMCLGTFLLARRHHSDDAARALTFVVLVVAMVVVILVNRSATRSAIAMLRVPNTAVRAVLLGAAVFLTLALYIPVARTLFHFAPLDVEDLGLAVAGGVLCVIGFDALKRRRHDHDHDTTPQHTKSTTRSS